MMNNDNNFKVAELINHYNKVREVASDQVEKSVFRIRQLDNFIAYINNRMIVDHFDEESSLKTFGELQSSLIDKREEKNKIHLTRIFGKMASIDGYKSEGSVDSDAEINENLSEEVSMLKKSSTELLNNNNGTLSQQELDTLNKLVKEIDSAIDQEAETRKIQQNMRYVPRNVEA
jgi:hypothetical protein